MASDWNFALLPLSGKENSPCSPPTLLPPPHALLPLPPPLARESRLAPLFASVCARSTSSALAKELIANLLNVEPAARLTAPQVLCSPWCRASDMRLD